MRRIFLFLGVVCMNFFFIQSIFGQSHVNHEKTEEAIKKLLNLSEDQSCIGYVAMTDFEKNLKKWKATTGAEYNLTIDYSDSYDGDYILSGRKITNILGIPRLNGMEQNIAICFKFIISEDTEHNSPPDKWLKFKFSNIVLEFVDLKNYPLKDDTVLNKYNRKFLLDVQANGSKIKFDKELIRKMRDWDKKLDEANNRMKGTLSDDERKQLEDFINEKERYLFIYSFLISDIDWQLHKLRMDMTNSYFSRPVYDSIY